MSRDMRKAVPAMSGVSVTVIDTPELISRCHASLGVGAEARGDRHLGLHGTNDELHLEYVSFTSQ